MEKHAFHRFKIVADKINIRLIVNEEDCDVPLMIVEVIGVKISDK